MQDLTNANEKERRVPVTPSDFIGEHEGRSLYRATVVEPDPLLTGWFIVSFLCMCGRRHSRSVPQKSVGVPVFALTYCRERDSGGLYFVVTAEGLRPWEDHV